MYSVHQLHVFTDSAEADIKPYPSVLIFVSPSQPPELHLELPCKQSSSFVLKRNVRHRAVTDAATLNLQQSLHLNNHPKRNTNKIISPRHQPPPSIYSAVCVCTTIN